jgi:hypothetical protein
MSNLLQQSRPEAKVRDVAVAVHVAGVCFGTPRPGMRRRDVAAVGFHLTESRHGSGF